MNNRRLGWIIAVLAGLALVPLLAPARHGALTQAPGTSWEELAAGSVLALKGSSLDEAFRLQAEAMASVTPARPGDIRPARTLVLLGEIQQSANQPELAERSYLQAVAACEEAVGQDNPAVIECLDSLANFYYYRNQVEKVVPLYERILRISSNELNRAHREVANRARNLATIHQMLDNEDEAETLFRQSLDAGARSGAVFQSDLIHDMMTAAAFYRTCEKFDESASLAQRALAMAEQAMGAESMDVALGLDCLGETHLAAGKPDQAEPLFARALAITEQVTGPESADLAPRLAALADSLRDQKKYEQAESQLARALDLTESHLGLHSLELAALLDEYAVLLEEMGRTDDADARSKQAESIRKHPSDQTIPNCPTCQLE